jgi:hypothetical protein
MNCSIYNNWNERNPQYQEVIHLKNEILKLKKPEERMRFRKENEHIQYIFCDGEFHFKSKCEDFMHWVSKHKCRDFKGRY